MSLGKTVLIIVIILALFWYVAPNEFNSGKNALFSFFTSEKTKTAVNSGINSLKDGVQSNIDNTINTTNSDTTTNNIELDDDDPCNWPNKAYPNFEGTVYEGDTCANSGKDLDTVCLGEYKPIDYEGQINLLQETSDPEMKCCLADGYCYWRD